MIDPRLLNPEPIRPTTEVTTPSPQFIQQGVVRGGAFQLGDIAGKRPQVDPTANMYNNLAKIAEASLKFIEAPAMLEAADQKAENLQRRKDEQHDNGLLEAYGVTSSEIDAAKESDNPVYTYGEKKYDLTDPEQMYQLKTAVATQELSGLKSDAGKIKYNEIVGGTLKTRNQTFDTLAEQLSVEYETRYNAILEENIGANDADLDHILSTDTELIRIAKDISGLGDNPSTQVREKIHLGLEKRSFEQQRKALTFIKETAGQQVRAAIGTMIEKLEAAGSVQGTLISAFMGGNSEAPIDVFAQMFGDDATEFQKFAESVGIETDENGNYSIAPGGTFSNFIETPTADNFQSLFERYVVHEITTGNSEIDEASASRMAHVLLTPYRSNIERIASGINRGKTQGTATANNIQNSMAQQGYIDTGVMPDIPNVFMSPAFSTTLTPAQAREASQDVTLGVILAPIQEGKEWITESGKLVPHVQNTANRASVDYFGSMGKPVTTTQQTAAAKLLGINRDLLTTTGLYEEKDVDGDGVPELLLTEAGNKRRLQWVEETVNQAYSATEYQQVLVTTLRGLPNNIEYIGNIMSLAQARTKIAKDLVSVFEERYPAPSGGWTEENVLRELGVSQEDPTGKLNRFFGGNSGPIIEIARQSLGEVARQHKASKGTDDSVELPDGYDYFKNDNAYQTLGVGQTQTQKDKIANKIVELAIEESTVTAEGPDGKPEFSMEKFGKWFASIPGMATEEQQSVIAANLVRAIGQRQFEVLTGNQIATMIQASAIGAQGAEALTISDLSQPAKASSFKELTLNPEFMDGGKLTPEGQKEFIKLMLPLVMPGSEISDVRRTDVKNGLRGVLAEAIKAEGNYDRNTAGALVMYGSMMRILDASTRIGLNGRHERSENMTHKRSFNITLPNGEKELVEIEMDPMLNRSQYEAVFGPEGQTTTAATYRLGLRVMKELSPDGANIDDVIKNLKADGAAFGTIARMMIQETSDIGSQNAPPQLKSQLRPQLRSKQNEAYAPSNAGDIISALEKELRQPNPDFDFVVNGFVNMALIFSDLSEDNPVGTANNKQNSRVIAEEMARYFKAAHLNPVLPVSYVMLRSYIAKNKDEENIPIQEGDLLPLYSSDPNELTWLGLFTGLEEKYVTRKDNRDGVFAADDGVIFDTNDTDEYKTEDAFYELARTFLRVYNAQDPSYGPDREVRLNSLLNAGVVGLAQNSSLRARGSTDGSLLGAVDTLVDVFIMTDGITGQITPHTIPNYGLSGRSGYILRKLPEQYQGVDIGLGGHMGASKLRHPDLSPSEADTKKDDQEDYPLFESYGQEVGAKFFYAKPSTANDREKFVEARGKYVFDSILKDIVVTPEQRRDILFAAEQDTTNLHFLVHVEDIMDIDLTNARGNAKGEYPSATNFGPSEATRNQEYYRVDFDQGSDNLFIKGGVVPIALDADVLKYTDSGLTAQYIRDTEVNRRNGITSPRRILDRNLDSYRPKKYTPPPPTRNYPIENKPQAMRGGGGGVMGSIPVAIATLAMGATPAMATPPQQTPEQKAFITETSSGLAKLEGFIATPKIATKGEKHRTVGYGHLLDGSQRSKETWKKTFPNKNYKAFQQGKGKLTKAEAQKLLNADLPQYMERAKKLTKNFDSYSSNLQQQIIFATYRGSWKQSPKTRRLLSEGKFEEAAVEFLNNDEYRNARQNNRAGIIPRMEAVAAAIRAEGKRSK